MPEIAAWIDELRQAFGRDVIDGQIRRGLRGEVLFHAREGGHELGKPGPAGVPITLSQATEQPPGKRKR